MDFLGLSRQEPLEPLPGAEYLKKLHSYLLANQARLAPSIPKSASPSFLQQSYTLLTLGLDPSSAPLSRNVKVPLTLGFGTPQQPTNKPLKPLLLRLPPDRLLYLLLRWQSLPQSLNHVGRTDEPIPPGLTVAARGARATDGDRRIEGDVTSVRSWVGSMRSVSMGSVAKSTMTGFGWLGKKEEIKEDQILLALYTMFTVLPALLIHPPFVTDRPIEELVDAGGYTQLGGIDVRVPLDVMRNLQILELEGYDPRGLLIPVHPGLRSLTVRDVQDADDWLEELLIVQEVDQSDKPRFPNLRHLSLYSTTLLALPELPLTSLTHLDLSYNLLNSLPPSLASLSSLQSLNLSNNVITSLRNAPSTLGNITSLNLSKNRIDCLVGLERVLGLERIDLRHNEIVEWDELGRLSVLPHIKEIWCVGNPFDGPGRVVQDNVEEWRIELGVAFGKEGKEVVLDDRPWSWNESRKVESLLAQRGYGRNPHSRQSSGESSRPSQSQPQHREHRPHAAPAPQPSRPTSSTSPIPPRQQAAPVVKEVAVKHNPVVKKKKPRRVINLDDEGSGGDSDQPVGGSLRLPAKTNLHVDEPAGTIPSLAVKKKEKRKVSTSMFEPR